MDLSVIIVNYNVKYFLEQCLYAVQKAMVNISGEIWVVDNNSVDGSVQMLSEKFPQVQVIANSHNAGFSKANNQAIREANGRYILLLNPDTLVEEDTFEKCIRFMDNHSECGALGVKMINGKGCYLPESKRGLPSPQTSFFKMAGLARLFPRSKRFAKYYLGHLDPEQTHPVEVLCGAFMLMPKKVLDTVGLLDEAYFMYGEDIDLSYRITKAGFVNYYFPETRIIHYKGESTKKASLNYVYTFYNAMSIFVKTHFKGKHAVLLSSFIKMAIWLAAFLAVIKRTIQTWWLPVLDFILVWSGAALIKNIWAQLKWGNVNYYPSEYVYIIPFYIAIILLSIFLCGGYDKPFRYKTLLSGVLMGMGILLVYYFAAGEAYRYSRILIILDGVWAFSAMSLLRFILQLIGINNFSSNKNKKQYVIIGEFDECQRVRALLQNLNPTIEYIGYVSNELNPTQLPSQYIGNKRQLEEIIRIYQINEVIFCGKNMQAQEIISAMFDLQQTGVEYKIAPEESSFIIGSNTISSIEDLFMVDLNTINSVANKRNKRLLDLGFSVLFLITLPVLLFFVKQKMQFLKNGAQVFIAKISWVGYAKPIQQKLPVIKSGILAPTDILFSEVVEPETIEKLNLMYAKNYRPSYDIRLIISCIDKIGNKPV